MTRDVRQGDGCEVTVPDGVQSMGCLIIRKRKPVFKMTQEITIVSQKIFLPTGTRQELGSRSIAAGACSLLSDAER